MDYEGPAVSSSQVVKARKAHRCCECGEVIRPGALYECYSGCWDGSWARYRTCLPCMRIRDDLCSCGFVFGQLREAIWEALGMDYITGEGTDR